MVTAVLAALSLTACALPLPVAIAGYVADGVLLAATGKTVGDAAISTAAEQDCAVWRVLMDEPVCRDYAPGEAPTLTARMPDAAEGGEGGAPIPVSVVLTPVPADRPIQVAGLPPLPLTRSARIGNGFVVPAPVPDDKPHRVAMSPPLPQARPFVLAPVPQDKPLRVAAVPPLPRNRPAELDT